MVDINVRHIYDWWIGDLSRTLTPRRVAARSWKTLLLSTPIGLEIHTKGSASAAHLGTLPNGASGVQVAELKTAVAKSAETNPNDVLLRLSDADVVERIIQVPKAASDVIDPIVRNQLERIVPWPEGETHFGYRVIGPNANAASQLDVRIVATSRKILDTMLTSARSLGLDPSAAEFAPSSHEDAPVELMSRAPDPTKKTADVLQAGLVALAVGCAAIGAFGLYSVWDRQSQRDDLADSIAMVSARVEVNRGLYARNAELKQQHMRLIGQKTDNPAVMLLIERLSTALPDSAYLTELGIHGRDARIMGKSDNSTALITALEDAAEFEDVHFSAPTTREEGESAETFAIIAKVHGRRVPEKRP